MLKEQSSSLDVADAAGTGTTYGITGGAGAVWQESAHACSDTITTMASSQSGLNWSDVSTDTLSSGCKVGVALTDEPDEEAEAAADVSDKADLCTHTSAGHFSFSAHPDAATAVPSALTSPGCSDQRSGAECFAPENLTASSTSSIQGSTAAGTTPYYAAYHKNGSRNRESLPGATLKMPAVTGADVTGMAPMTAAHIGAETMSTGAAGGAGAGGSGGGGGGVPPRRRADFAAGPGRLPPGAGMGADAGTGAGAAASASAADTAAAGAAESVVPAVGRGHELVLPLSEQSLRRKEQSRRRRNLRELMQILGFVLLSEHDPDNDNPLLGRGRKYLPVLRRQTIVLMLLMVAVIGAELSYGHVVGAALSFVLFMGLWYRHLARIPAKLDCPELDAVLAHCALEPQYRSYLKGRLLVSPHELSLSTRRRDAASIIKTQPFFQQLPALLQQDLIAACDKGDEEAFTRSLGCARLLALRRPPGAAAAASAVGTTDTAGSAGAGAGTDAAFTCGVGLSQETLQLLLAHNLVRSAADQAELARQGVSGHIRSQVVPYLGDRLIYPGFKLPSWYLPEILTALTRARKQHKKLHPGVGPLFASMDANSAVSSKNTATAASSPAAALELKENLWGFGAPWRPEHMRRFYQMQSDGLGQEDDNPERHGLKVFQQILGSEGFEPVSSDDMASHTLILGTTGAGKTRMFDLQITQAVLRGEVVVVLDPKGDRDLKQTLFNACTLAGRDPLLTISCCDLARPAAPKVIDPDTVSFLKRTMGCHVPVGACDPTSVLTTLRHNMHQEPFPGAAARQGQAGMAYCDDEHPAAPHTPASLRASTQGYGVGADDTTLWQLNERNPELLIPAESAATGAGGSGADGTGTPASSAAAAAVGLIDDFFDGINRGINPIGSSTSPARIAECLCSSLAQDGSGASFRSYAFRMVMAAVKALELTGTIPTMARIREVVNNFGILERSIRQHVNELVVTINRPEISLFYNRIHGITDPALKQNSKAVTLLLGPQACGRCSKTKERQVITRIQEAAACSSGPAASAAGTGASGGAASAVGTGRFRAGVSSADLEAEIAGMGAETGSAESQAAAVGAVMSPVAAELLRAAEEAAGQAVAASGGTTGTRGRKTTRSKSTRGTTGRGRGRAAATAAAPGAAAAAESPAAAKLTVVADNLKDDGGVPEEEGREVSAPRLELLQEFCRWLQEHYGLDQDLAGLEVLFEICRENPEYLSKVSGNIKPVLELLNDGNNRELLSPDSDNGCTLRQVMSSRGILYVNLNCMGESTGGRILGQILLVELAQLASERLHLPRNHQGNSVPRIACFVDEAGELANESLIQLLNKARSAGVRMTLATQTVKDLNRNGDFSEQILGNCNNLIALRLNSLDTANRIVSMFPQTSVTTSGAAVGVSQRMTDDPAIPPAVNMSRSHSLSETIVPLFPPSAFMRLPDFEFMAVLSGRPLIKGFIPIITGPSLDTLADCYARCDCAAAELNALISPTSPAVAATPSAVVATAPAPKETGASAAPTAPAAVGPDMGPAFKGARTALRPAGIRRVWSQLRPPLPQRTQLSRPVPSWMGLFCELMWQRGRAAAIRGLCRLLLQPGAWLKGIGGIQALGAAVLCTVPVMVGDVSWSDVSRQGQELVSMFTVDKETPSAVPEYGSNLQNVAQDAFDFVNQKWGYSNELLVNALGSTDEPLWLHVHSTEPEPPASSALAPVVYKAPRLAAIQSDDEDDLEDQNMVIKDSSGPKFGAYSFRVPSFDWSAVPQVATGRPAAASDAAAEKSPAPGASAASPAAAYAAAAAAEDAVTASSPDNSDAVVIASNGKVQPSPELRTEPDGAGQVPAQVQNQVSVRAQGQALTHSLSDRQSREEYMSTVEAETLTDGSSHYFLILLIFALVSGYLNGSHLAIQAKVRQRALIGVINQRRYYSRLLFSGLLLVLITGFFVNGSYLPLCHLSLMLVFLIWVHYRISLMVLNINVISN